jgi:dTDP-4-amino-4,6-dideoxygalactose transaminase
MVTTNSDEFARRARYLRNHGQTGMPPEDPTGEYPWTMGVFDEIGFNLRLSDIQAAIGLAQLKKLDSLVRERRQRAARYSQSIQLLSDVAVPSGGVDNGHTYQSYVIRILEGGRMRRNAVMRTLQERGIQTRPGTHAVHRLGYYRKKYGYHAEDFPNAALAEDTTITLPIFPGMTDDDQDRVVAALQAGLAQPV